MLDLGYVSITIDETGKGSVGLNDCDSDCDCWCDYDSCNDSL